jgi:energy-coupling factor transport system ATP-binding protein
MSSLSGATIASLSGGQKQRTAIAATLAMGPDVLVLDEPLSDLDPVGAQEVLNALRCLATDERRAVMVIEHRVDEVLGWCDRVVLMDRGRIVLDSPADRAFADTEPWVRSGVGLPDVIHFAHALGGPFDRAAPPLTPTRAARELADTPFAETLRSALSRPDPVGTASLDDLAPTPRREPAVSWSSVSVCFGGPPVLKDVSLKLEAGGWTAIAGANGSGKTTLAHTSVGLQAPDGGEVTLFGQPVDSRHIGAQTGTAGLLLQAADEMLFASTVAGELRFGWEHRAPQLRSPFLDVESVTNAFGFAELGDRSPWELSQGGRQRLALAALLVGAPGLLILDEPTTGQDNEHRRAFMSLLDTVRDQTDMTLLMVTHDMRSVASRAERLIVLGDGVPQFDGPPRVVFARARDLERWGVLPPPLARLQHELVGDEARWVALDAEELVGLMTTSELPATVSA